MISGGLKHKCQLLCLFWHEEKNRFRGLWALYTVLYLLFFYPIIAADYSYNDDLDRAVQGYKGWTALGRPLASIMLMGLDFSTSLMDISPLPQLMGIAFLSLASCLLALYFRFSRWYQFLALTPIVMGCFFLENFSYKFDAPFMAFPILCAALAFFAERFMSGWRLCLFMAAVIAAGLICYQSGVNVFLVLALFMILLKLQLWGVAQGFRYAVQLGIVTVLALLIYKVVVSLVAYGDYYNSHGQFINLVQHPEALLSNIVASARYQLHAFQGYEGGQWTAVVVMLALIWMLIRPLVARSEHSLSLPSRMLTMLLSLVLIIGMLLATMGPLLLLQTLELTPRIVFPLGTLIGCCLVYLTCFPVRGAVTRGTLALVIVSVFYPQYVTSYAYGNVLSSVGSIERYISRQVNEDYAAYGEPNGMVLLMGQLPETPVQHQINQQIPVIRYLARTTLYNASIPGGWQLAYYGLSSTVGSYNRLSSQDDLARGMRYTRAVRNQCAFTTVAWHKYYDAYRVDDTLIIDFEKNCGARIDS